MSKFLDRLITNASKEAQSAMYRESGVLALDKSLGPVLNDEVAREGLTFIRVWVGNGLKSGGDYKIVSAVLINDGRWLWHDPEDNLSVQGTLDHFFTSALRAPYVPVAYTLQNTAEPVWL